MLPIHSWVWLDLHGATSLKETESPLPEATSCHSSSFSGGKLSILLLLHARMLIGWIWWGPCAGDHSCCKYSHPAMSRGHFTVGFSSLWLLQSLWWSWALRRDYSIHVPFLAQPSSHMLSLHSVSFCTNHSLLCWGLRTEDRFKEESIVSMPLKFMSSPTMSSWPDL